MLYCLQTSMMIGANTMQIKPWEVWFASVRFEDSPDVKARPVVVTSSGAVYVCALKVTSHKPRNRWGEYQLKQWQYAGLKYESTVRVEKQIRLERRDMIHRLGTLHPIDILGIQDVIASKR